MRRPYLRPLPAGYAVKRPLRLTTPRGLHGQKLEDRHAAYARAVVGPHRLGNPGSDGDALRNIRKSET